MPLQRYYSKYKHRHTSYFNPLSNGLFSEITRLHQLAEGASLADILATCDTPVLYMLPDSRGAYPSVADFKGIAGCDVKKYLSKRKSAKVRYQGKVIDLYPISTWFDVKPSATLGREAMKGHKLLHDLLEAAFQPHKVHAGFADKFPLELLATPAQLGADLLKRSLPYDRIYEPLPEAEADFIIARSTQGRIETFYHGNDLLNDLNCYDGRWMYASCYRHVPTGPILHDSIPEVMPYAVGFYRAEVRVPDEWQHIGLLPYKTKDGYSYPRRAGVTFETFASSAEIALALKQNWHIRVIERVLWPDTDKHPEPLRMWGDRLVKLRMEIAETLDEPYRSMIKSSVRNIMLQTIGGFFRHVSEYDGYTSDVEAIPEEATSFELLEGDIWKFTLSEKMSPLQKMLCQAQWAAWIWGQARKKLAEAALQVPFSQLVALRVDGIWTNCPVDFPDTGKVGQFTKKALLQSSGLQWPHNTREMVRLVQQVKG